MKARLTTGAAAAAWVVLVTASVASGANVSVGAGSSLDLGTGSLELSCADLTVAGTLSAGTVGFGAARDVTIDPAGVLNGNSATLDVAGDWDNAGTFNAGTSTVQLVDGCGLSSAVIAGNNVFASLEMITTSGKQYQFTAGSTQTVTTSLTLAGVSGNLLQIRSTVDGSEAFLDLQGSQSVSFVDVRDNRAIGTPIELDAGSRISGNTLGWRGPMLPALSLLGLTLLALALAWSGRRHFMRAAPS